MWSCLQRVPNHHVAQTCASVLSVVSCTGTSRPQCPQSKSSNHCRNMTQGSVNPSLALVVPWEPRPNYGRTSLLKITSSMRSGSWGEGHEQYRWVEWPSRGEKIPFSETTLRCRSSTPLPQLQYTKTPYGLQDIHDLFEYERLPKEGFP